MSNTNQLLTILMGHKGKGNGIRAKQLAGLLGVPEREVRKMMSDLRMDEHPICGTPSDGYYMAATWEELEETCRFHRSRAGHSMKIEAALRKISLVDLLERMRKEALNG
jgi:predicted DNA-binding transcriptional regulator YafY